MSKIKREHLSARREPYLLPMNLNRKTDHHKEKPYYLIHSVSALLFAVIGKFIR
jgi:hypothetical protein